MEFPKSLIVVVGPTAVGKTAMAIALAKHYQTSIISADSRQFYSEMSIGTAKPSAQELQEATHYFINSHSISDDYSAGDFEREALLQVEKLFEESDKVIVVGGSGLFVRALCEGLDDLPKAPEAIREALNAALERDGLAALQERLRAIDSDNYEQMDHDNPQRVVRDLEVYEATGKPISYYQKNQRSKRNFNIITVGLNTDRAVLYDRINRRVDLMMQEGLLEEVKSLIPYRAKPALLTVGYAELFDYLDGNISLAQAIDSIKQNSRRYAKRQITWFKKYGGTTWFGPKQLEDIIEFIDSKTKK